MKNAVAFGFRRRFGEAVALRLRSSRLSAYTSLAHRRTADRSHFLFFTVQPRHRNFQAFGDGRHFVIHQITILPLNARNGRLVENDTPASQTTSEVILRNRRFAL
jgi:hypothetical protein